MYLVSGLSSEGVTRVRATIFILLNKHRYIHVIPYYMELFMGIKYKTYLLKEK